MFKQKWIINQIYFPIFILMLQNKHILQGIGYENVVVGSCIFYYVKFSSGTSTKVKDTELQQFVT